MASSKVPQARSGLYRATLNSHAVFDGWLTASVEDKRLDGRDPFVSDFVWPGVPGKRSGHYINGTGGAALHPQADTRVLGRGGDQYHRLPVVLSGQTAYELGLTSCGGRPRVETDHFHIRYGRCADAAVTESRRATGNHRERRSVLPCQVEGGVEPVARPVEHNDCAHLGWHLLVRPDEQPRGRCTDRKDRYDQRGSHQPPVLGQPAERTSDWAAGRPQNLAGRRRSIGDALPRGPIRWPVPSRQGVTSGFSWIARKSTPPGRGAARADSNANRWSRLESALLLMSMSPRLAILSEGRCACPSGPSGFMRSTPRSNTVTCWTASRRSIATPARSPLVGVERTFVDDGQLICRSALARSVRSLYRSFMRLACGGAAPDTQRTSLLVRSGSQTGSDGEGNTIHGCYARRTT